MSIDQVWGAGVTRLLFTPSEPLGQLASPRSTGYAFAVVNETTPLAIDENERIALAAVRSGTSDAYGYLVGKYMRKALSIAWGIVRDGSDAEDVVQDAFVRAYERIGSMRSDQSFAPWLFRIVTNLALDHVRRRGRRAEEEVSEHLKSPLQTDAIAGETIARRIDEAIESLPEMQRLVARLYLVEEFTHAEIAEITGLSDGTVRSHLSHARKKLQQSLSDVYEATNG